jgi:hypothetical protein
MPAVAMKADSRIKIQDLDSFRGTSPRSRNSPSCSSGKVRRTRDPPQECRRAIGGSPGVFSHRLIPHAGFGRCQCTQGEVGSS